VKIRVYSWLLLNNRFIFDWFRIRFNPIFLTDIDILILIAYFRLVGAIPTVYRFLDHVPI